MGIVIVTTNYFDNGVFGTYSNVKRAHIALEHFLAKDEDIISFEDTDEYFYQFTTKNGATFSAEIIFNILDNEFEEGICKED